MRHRYLTFLVGADDIDAAAPRLARARGDVQQTLTRIRCEARMLDGAERLELIQSQLRPGIEPDVYKRQYIYGSVGRGKSYSAAALANAFVDAGYRTVFTTASAMLERIKASFSGNGETDSVISRYAACDVLVLVDLGKEDAKEWSSNMMFLVINARYENMRPTIFTSNYSPQALSKRLGRKGETETAEAIASRLSETTIPIHLTGPDMRIASRM